MASSSSSAPRQEMISSAVSFLQDPKVSSSSVAQRIAFLESKGLSSGEIDEALRRSGVVGGGAGGPPPPPQQSGQMQQYQYGPQQGGYYYPPPPNQGSQGRDWRDWFIMAVVSGTIGYGVIALARRYLFPHLQPPNQTVLEADRDALTAKYDEVAATLSQLDSETRAVKAGLEQQKSAIDAELKLVEEALEQLRTGERSRKEEMERIAREVDAMKRDMPKMFESSSSSTTTSLTELQSELKSLRSLLVSRTSNSNGNAGGGGMTSSVSGPIHGSSGYSSPMRTGNGSPPPVPSFGGSANGGKPAIPAWQLAASNGSAGGAGSASSSSSEKEKTSEGGAAAKEGAKEPAKENGAYDV